MSLFSRKRFVVSTLLIGVDARARAIFDAIEAASHRIVDAEDDFDVASAELARIAEVLLEHENEWSHIANWGEVFRKEEDASAYGEQNFADCAGRYLSTGAGSEAEPNPNVPQGTSVVMITIAYEGEVPEIEKTLATRDEIVAALDAIRALHHKDQLLLAHLHQSPGTREEALSEDQLLVNYPELLAV